MTTNTITRREFVLLVISLLEAMPSSLTSEDLLRHLNRYAKEGFE